MVSQVSPVSQVSHRGLQQLIGAALVDADVLSALLDEPLSLADRFELTMPERRFLTQMRAPVLPDLEEFAALVETWKTHQPLVRYRSVADRVNDAPLAG